MKHATKQAGKSYTVYGLVNPRTNNIRYIGQTTNKARRTRQHRMKYPTLELHTIGECDSEAEMQLWEWLFIELLRPPLNAVAGGGISPSTDPKVRAKISAARKKYLAENPDSAPMKRPEVRAKLKKYHADNPDKHPMKNPKARAKLSASLKKYYTENPDKHPSKRPEVRAKMSVSMKKYRYSNPDKHPLRYPGALAKMGMAHRKPVICITTGDRFSSGVEAQQITGIPSQNISACIRGKVQSAGKTPDGRKRVWQYIDKK